MADKNDGGGSFAVGATVAVVLSLVCVLGVSLGCYCAWRRASAKANKVVSRCSLPEVSAPSSPNGSRQVSRTNLPIVVSPSSPPGRSGRLYVSSSRRISSGNLPYTSTSNKNLPAVRSPNSPVNVSPGMVRERIIGEEKSYETKAMS